MAVVRRCRKDHGRGRWMAPVMLVLAGVSGAPAAADVVEVPEWRTAFAAAGVSGAVALRRLGDRRSFVSDLDGAGRGLPPASTFRIPHLLIALETGVVRDLGQVRHWDGKVEPAPDRSMEQDDRCAVQSSAVSVFQAIARTIGEDRMATWLARLQYGNASTAGGVDRFWLDGGLRVTPTQQLDFLERLLLGTLPASGRAQAIARDALPDARMGFHDRLYGQTGWSRPHGDEGPDVGWWVGWVERPGEVWLFATSVEGHPERILDARRNVTLAVLERLGMRDAATGDRFATVGQRAAAR